MTDQEKKEKARIASREWKKRNREKVREYNKQWRKDHPEKVREYSARTRSRHKDVINACNLNYYHTTLKKNAEAMEKRKEYHKEWLEKNRERWNSYNREYRRRKKEIAKNENV